VFVSGGKGKGVKVICQLKKTLFIPPRDYLKEYKIFTFFLLNINSDCKDLHNPGTNHN
jgi:hypothetical protein